MAKKVLEKKSEAVAAPTQAPASTPITGKFFIKKAKDGSYMFNLRASNGETIATSDMYSSLEKCKKGITSVQMNAPIANIEDHTVSGAIDEVVNPKYEMYYDKSGDYRFRLKAKNGSIIVKSQGYSSKSNCVAGIESVRKNAMSDIILDEDALAAEKAAREAEKAAAKKAAEVQEEPVAPAEEAPKGLFGKFIIRQAKDGSYMFNLKASNGEIIATSDMYSSLEKCKKGIASIQNNAPIANIEDSTVEGEVEVKTNPKFEMYRDKGGEFRFRLKAKNGSIIAKSQGYSSKTNCKNGIESVKKNAATEEIISEKDDKN
jgi:uncharacterized protein YegP (UPF0339 family)